MTGPVTGPTTGPTTALSRWLAERAADRRAAGTERRLVARSAVVSTIDLAGNDYLGLARDPAVVAAAADAVERWGAGAGASRLVTGTLELHGELERELAAALGTQAALVCSTGYHANLGAVTALADAGTLVVSDAHVHASLVDACRLARAEVVVVPHADVAAVEQALAARHQPRALVLTESVFSVLGDAAPLETLSQLCMRHDATLLVDEAHALGVTGGSGLGQVVELGLAAPHVVVTLTLSKSLGSQGGAILGTRAVVDHLINTARPFIFDTGLAPASTAAALAALRRLLAEPALAAQVRRRAVELAGICQGPPGAGAIVPVPMPSAAAAVAAQPAASTAGVRVGCFRPPSVPDGISRLRLTAHAGLSDADIVHTDEVLTSLLTVQRSTPAGSARMAT